MIGYAMDVAPEGAPAVWGARAILQGQYVDILHDRQSLVGDTEPRGELIRLLNGGILEQAREAVAALVRVGEMSSTRADDIVLHMDDRVVLIGNTNGSYGYLYLTAFLMPR